MHSFTLRAAPPILIATLLALAAVSSPALALCKYGSPHCVNPNPGPKLPVVNTTQIPDSTWIDPDCAYYGNCH
jgi:hypothetical protein